MIILISNFVVPLYCTWASGILIERHRIRSQKKMISSWDASRKITHVLDLGCKANSQFAGCSQRPVAPSRIHLHTLYLWGCEKWSVQRRKEQKFCRYWQFLSQLLLVWCDGQSNIFHIFHDTPWYVNISGFPHNNDALPHCKLNPEVSFCLQRANRCSPSRAASAGRTIDLLGLQECRPLKMFCRYLWNVHAL